MNNYLTVGELIKKLEKIDKDFIIETEKYEDDGDYRVNFVSENKEECSVWIGRKYEG